MVVTMLDNGKLLKYQTLEDGKVVPFFKVDKKEEFGNKEVPMSAEEREEDWANLANYPEFDGDKNAYKEALKRKIKVKID